MESHHTFSHRAVAGMNTALKRVASSLICGVVVAGAALVIDTLPLQGQYLGGGSKTAAEVQIADLEQMRDKFIGLGESFPENLYDWRPMEGVRSVREVFVLIVAEGTQFPTMWDFSPPEWVAEGGFANELSRVRAMDKAGIITELGRSFDHVVTLAKGLSDGDRARQVNFFGLQVDLGTALTLMQTDMHEHLGQAIAYARMNGIVPPWSR